MQPLPEIDLAAFSARMAAAGAPIAPPIAERLHAHYEELRRWAPRVDLVGPGVAGEIVERHYAEALAGLAWIPAVARRLVDLGSGAGFPGFVLAAARPELEIWLVEPRERRAAFLAAAARRARLSVKVLAARVAPGSTAELPSGIDVVTVRALRLDPRDLRALLPHLTAGGRLLVWSGERVPELPAGLTAGRERRLPGSERRFLRELLVATESA